jgi:hypothetical protein
LNPPPLIGPFFRHFPFSLRQFKGGRSTGKTTDAVFDEKKHTEFVIDDSNLDLSSECECKKKVDKLS